MANPQKYRKQTLVVLPDGGKKFFVDISKYEHFETTVRNIDGFQVQTYTLKTIVFEKLRALCQQMPEYRQERPAKEPRTADLWDIFMISERNPLAFTANDRGFLENVFRAKAVPIDLAYQIGARREIYQRNQERLLATLTRDSAAEFNLDRCLRRVEEIVYAVLGQPKGE